jgi:hypothetical protein
MLSYTEVVSLAAFRPVVEYKCIRVRIRVYNKKAMLCMMVKRLRIIDGNEEEQSDDGPVHDQYVRDMVHSAIVDEV